MISTINPHQVGQTFTSILKEDFTRIGRLGSWAFHHRFAAGGVAVGAVAVFYSVPSLIPSLATAGVFTAGRILERYLGQHNALPTANSTNSAADGILFQADQTDGFDTDRTGRFLSRMDEEDSSASTSSAYTATKSDAAVEAELIVIALNNPGEGGMKLTKEGKIAYVKGLLEQTSDEGARTVFQKYLTQIQ